MEPLMFVTRTLGVKPRRNFFQFLINYSIAIFAPVFMLFLTFVIYNTTENILPALIFFPAIALSAWHGGYKAGILASIISILLTMYFFMPPYRSFLVTPITNAVQVAIFFIESIVLSFLIDTDRKQNRLSDYKSRQKELLDKIASLELERTLAKSEIRSRDEILSIASHELKTPLTSMLLQTQNAIYSIKSVSLANFSIESLLKMLQSVESQTKRLSRMINDLLNVSLITTGNLQLDREEINLNSIVTEVLDEFSARIEREKYDLIYTEEKQIVGNWDKVRISQAISNLISNAIKYGDHKPIEVKTEKNGVNAKIIVKDNGIGIRSDQQRKIFGLFERGVSSDEYRGLGVGLYITNKIVKAHGGKIKVSSTKGKGSTFTISLPIK